MSFFEFQYNYFFKERPLRIWIILASAVVTSTMGCFLDDRYQMMATIPVAILLGWCHDHLCDFVEAVCAGCNKRGGV